MKSFFYNLTLCFTFCLAISITSCNDDDDLNAVIPAISADDTDGDGIVDTEDDCPNTPEAEIGNVDTNGCAPNEKDSDGDGIVDTEDNCADTPEGTEVNAEGCPVLTGVSTANYNGLLKAAPICVLGQCLNANILSGTAIPLGNVSEDALEIYNEETGSFTIKSDGTYTISTKLKTNSFGLDIAALLEIISLDIFSTGGTTVEIALIRGEQEPEVLQSITAKNNPLNIGALFLPTESEEVTFTATLEKGDIISLKLPDGILQPSFDVTNIFNLSFINSETFVSIERK